MPETNFLLLAAANGSNAALVSFTIYIVGVFVLAWLSNRVLQSKSFLSEYFLGSRSLGVWAFALTFAATSSSGGSFIGFPSLVYSHGWIVALWIASYMIVPIVSMGLLAKRINQVARKTGAITIPDLIRDRLNSPAVGTLATILIVFFMSVNLISQFKAGSVILQTLLDDVPAFSMLSNSLADSLAGLPIVGSSEDKPGYLLCLIVFSVAVVVYTTYGGFRAVVWTDVMQGFVMVGGVIIMLPLTLMAVGGLENATRQMAEMTPPKEVALKITTPAAVTKEINIDNNTWLVSEGESGRHVFRTSARCKILVGETIATRQDNAIRTSKILAIELTYQPHIDQQEATELDIPVSVSVQEATAYASGADQPGTYVTGPGPSASKNGGFLPITLAISFFCMWTFSGAGQPSNMVRLMAFKESKTLRRAIFTVSIYYTLIYFPLVIIFCCARVLLPGWESQSDRIMPEMAKFVTLAINSPWLAGLLVAAPFAAVMSTMDSFLLMISSAVVRDIYQRNINPQATEKQIKRLTYIATITVGVAAVLAAANPPQFLQDLIVFTGSGLSTSFLVPVGLAMYWRRYNAAGAVGSMLSGFAWLVATYAIGYMKTGKMDAIQPGGFHPFMLGIAISLVVGVACTLVTAPPDPKVVKKFFYAEK